MGSKILQGRPNNLVRLIGRSLSSVLADCTIGIGVIADCFHIAGNTPSRKDTLKIWVNGSVSSKANSLVILNGISLGCVAFEVFILLRLLRTSPGDISGGGSVGWKAGKLERFSHGIWLQTLAKWLFIIPASSFGSLERWSMFNEDDDFDPLMFFLHAYAICQMTRFLAH